MGEKMDFYELSKSRYSVRSFSDKKIESEKLQQILECARFAPTACNNQPQKIYVVQSEENIEKLKKICKCVFGANTVLIITSNTSEEWKNPFTNEYYTGEIDCSIVCTHLMLQAWELGIGSCWVGYFNPELVRKEFDIPQKEKIVALLPLGYPSEDSKPIAMHFSRKELKDTVKYI